MRYGQKLIGGLAFMKSGAHTSLFFRRENRVKLTSNKQRFKTQKTGLKVRNQEMDGSNSALPSILFRCFDDDFDF